MNRVKVVKLLLGVFVLSSARAKPEQCHANHEVLLPCYLSQYDLYVHRSCQQVSTSRQGEIALALA